MFSFRCASCVNTFISAAFQSKNHDKADGNEEKSSIFKTKKKQQPL